MKIAVYCYDDVNNPQCGGGGAFRELSIHRAMSSRHSVRFFTGNFPGARAIDDPGFICRHLGLAKSYLFSRISFSLYATVHSLFSSADIIAIPFSIYSPVLTFLLRPHKTVVLFFHVTGREAVRKYGMFGLIPLLMEKVVLSTARNFITLTDEMARDILRRRPNVCVRAGYVSFDSTLLSVTPTDENFILCFGRIDVHMKGIDILLPAFEKIASRFPNHALIIAGRGKESDIAWVKTRIAASPFRERIRCETNTSDEEKKRLFRTATFVCMPSRFEGWNIAAIEAAASSKATLGTKIHGLSDAIKENETGILVPAQDADALSEQMAVLLADSDLRRKLGTAGHAWAANFTLERVTKIQEEFYQQILEM